jgi:anthranilate phosphoribosyltransferase
MTAGVKLANELLDSGASLQKLEDLRRFFNPNSPRLA